MAKHKGRVEENPTAHWTGSVKDSNPPNWGLGGMSRGGKYRCLESEIKPFPGRGTLSSCPRTPFAKSHTVADEICTLCCSVNSNERLG